MTKLKSFAVRLPLSVVLLDLMMIATGDTFHAGLLSAMVITILWSLCEPAMEHDNLHADVEIMLMLRSCWIWSIRMAWIWIIIRSSSSARMRLRWSGPSHKLQPFKERARTRSKSYLSGLQIQRWLPALPETVPAAIPAWIENFGCVHRQEEWPGWAISVAWMKAGFLCPFPLDPWLWLYSIFVILSVQSLYPSLLFTCSLSIAPISISTPQSLFYLIWRPLLYPSFPWRSTGQSECFPEKTAMMAISGKSVTKKDSSSLNKGKSPCLCLTF